MVKIEFETKPETKLLAEQVFNDVGLDMQTALNVFLKACITYGGIPFALRSWDSVHENEELAKETLEALEESERIAKDPKRKGYESIEDLRKALGV